MVICTSCINARLLLRINGSRTRESYSTFSQQRTTYCHVFSFQLLRNTTLFCRLSSERHNNLLSIVPKTVTYSLFLSARFRAGQTQLRDSLFESSAAGRGGKERAVDAALEQARSAPLNVQAGVRVGAGRVHSLLGGEGPQPVGGRG